MLKKSALVCLSAAQLVACGGGGSSSDASQSPAPEFTTVNVVDGYLENASVCVDRNLDYKCSPSEFIDAKTDAFGKIDLPTADLKYPLIANIFAGETKDSDRLAPSSKSYQMIAPAGIKTINPFTTIAHLSDQTIESLANQLNLAPQVLTLDFVDKRSDSIDAAIAHLLARSITKDFSSTLAQTAPLELQAKMAAFKDKADTLSNELDIVELNKRTLRQLPDGSVTSDELMVNSLADYLEQNGEFQISSIVNDGSMKTATFNGANVLGSWTDSIERSYSTSNNQLTLAALNSEPEIQLQFIYLSHHLSIAYDESSKALQAWTHKEVSPDMGLAIQGDQLRAQTITLLQPSAIGELELITLNFANEGNQVDVEFYDATPDTTATWLIEDNGSNVLHIDPPEGSKAPRIALLIVEDAAQHWLAYNLSTRNPVIAFNDKDIAHRIVDYWRVRNDQFIHGHYAFSDIIKGSEYHYFPMTNSMDASDLFSAYQFIDDSELCEANADNSWACGYNYNLLFNDLRLSHKETYDLNFRRSNQFLIGLGENNNPGIWLRNPQNRMITPENNWFSSKTWYWVRDINSDANGSAKPTMVALKFLENNQVEIDAPDIEPFTTDWQLRPYVEKDRAFTSVYIPIPEELRDTPSLRNEDFIQFAVMTKADDAMVVEVLSTLTLSRENLMLSTKALADYLVERWETDK